ncbi:nicotinate phosphoribosyltransferase [Rubeoparvulum massiliense]|uniref:nicotinate phosphoribosyltransferase n=1 Tax=Rubeoparvulum massiliense TaxID=1631346 RepID=UPI0009770FE1|nr:nicotinate phosphoribosyltransferase [Rubeoparvulum massiliense]
MGNESITRNLTLLTDFYQMTMMSSEKVNPDQEVVFDIYFRRAPSGSQFVIAAGLEQAIDYLRNLHFSEDDLSYLRSLQVFDEAFLERLASFRFTCEVYAMPEGSVAFPQEPLMRIRGPWFQAQYVETALLTIINHQTLIATKAHRVVHAAQGGPIMEFGARRAQGPDAAIYGARASIIGGCASTSNVLAGKMFNIPVSGTISHAWVMRMPSELEAFRVYAQQFPDNCVLLVDTYDTLRSGMPNAIRVGHELREKGYTLKGIRLDSGDLAYMSKEARKMLDAAGLTETKIFASSDLDEYLIRELLMQGAKIDAWGVGTKLITSSDDPSLGGVYKLMAAEEDGKLVPKIKVSENSSKITNPGFKKVVRLIDKKSRKAIGDLIMLDEEELDMSKELELFDPVNTWKRKVIRNFEVQPLLVPIMKDGEILYQFPTLQEIQAFSREQLALFSEEHKRLTNPHRYHVDLSEKLWNLRQTLLIASGSTKDGVCHLSDRPKELYPQK